MFWLGWSLIAIVSIIILFFCCRVFWGYWGGSSLLESIADTLGLDEDIYEGGDSYDNIRH